MSRYAIDLIGRQSDRILEAFGLQERVDLRVRESGIGAEVAALELAPIAGHDRFEHVLPTVRRMDVARTQRGPFQIAELIEHKQRMIALVELASAAVPARNSASIGMKALTREQAWQVRAESKRTPGEIVGHQNLVGAGIGTVHGAYSHHGRQAAQAPE